MDLIQKKLSKALELHQTGKILKAIAIYEKILSSAPEHCYALYLVGTGYYQVGKLNNAIQKLNSAIKICPNYAEAYANRGIVFAGLNQYEQALDSYEQALKINPNLTEALINRGNVLKTLGKFDDAISSYNMAIELNPNAAYAYSNKGNVLIELNRLEDALSEYDNAIRVNPKYAEAFSNKGNALKDLNRLEEALDSYDQALRFNPNLTEAYINRGTVLKDLNLLTDALQSYDKAIRITPNSAIAHLNKAYALILLGNYQTGWALFEWRRLKEDTKSKYRDYPNPLYPDTECQDGSQLFIYPEQGLGDTIQFCRYVKQLAKLGFNVTFEVQPSLHSLISSLDPRINLISTGDSIPNFDYQTPLMSLPWIFNTTVDTIPAEPAYLSISNLKQQEWSERLGQKTKKRIGIVWSGSKTHKNDHNRSIQLADLIPIFTPDVEWHSLQKEYRDYDLELLDVHTEIHQHQQHLNDFTDTGALINEMDLIISVDTSVAHLAGALGKTLWLLLPFMPDYRWMLDREDSPWYPTAKLYRQDESRNWKCVIERVYSNIKFEFIY